MDKSSKILMAMGLLIIALSICARSLWPEKMMDSANVVYLGGTLTLCLGYGIYCHVQKRSLLTVIGVFFLCGLLWLLTIPNSFFRTVPL